MRSSVLLYYFYRLGGFATTMSFGEKLKAVWFHSKNRTGDLQTFFRDGTAFNLQLPKGDIQITPKIHMWEIEYKDHPRDPNQLAQKILFLYRYGFNQLILMTRKKLFLINFYTVKKSKQYSKMKSTGVQTLRPFFF